MSASLLNVATLPGAGSGQPGAAGSSGGIAQQAAQAAQAQGPLAGFEALLAAFFGDQGTGQAGAAAGTAAAQGPLLFAAQAQGAGKAADGKAGKAAAATDTAKTDPKDATSQAALDAAALAMLTQAPGGQPQPTAAAGPNAGGAADAGLEGKATNPNAVAQLALPALGADGKTAKAAAALAAQAGGAGQVQAGSTPTDDGKAAPAKPQAQPTATLPTPELTNQAAAVTAQALSPPVQPVATPTKATDAAPNAGGKDKTAEIKTARVEGAPISPPAPPSGSTKAEIVQMAAAAAGSGKDADAEERDPGAQGGAEPKAAPATDAGQPAQSFTNALNAQAANNPAALAHAATLVRGSPQTVANLAAQIAKKLDGRSTRFDVQLDPAGLGKVDVRVEIDAAGKMTAALNFDNQQAASELKSRAAELHRAMEQAGFDLSGGLSFDVSSQDGQAQRQGGDAQPSFRGRAFQAVLDGGADSAIDPQTAYRQTARSGVDIRI